MQKLVIAAEGDGTGKVKARRSRDSGFGKLDFSGAARKRTAVPRQMQRSLNPYALQGTRILRIRENPRQRGIQGRAPVAESLSQPVSVGDAAELRAGRSAAGENHGIGMKLFRTAAQSVSGSVRPNFLDGEGAALFNPGAVQPEAQNVQHTVGGIRQGIDSPVRLGGGQETEMGKKPLRIDGTELRKRIGGKRRIRTEIVSRAGIPIAEVAAPVSGGKKLSPETLLTFQQEHMAAGDL